jgi:predicted Zn-dependent peptidase
VIPVPPGTTGSSSRRPARRSAQRIAEEIDAVGGELNAFTAKEHTCFYAHVIDSDVDLAMDLVSDVVFDARCDAADVDTERPVVLAEIAIRDDDPEDLLHEEFCVALLGEHPLGLPVLGTEESISAMTRETLYDFWREHYQPPRVVVSVAGNIDHHKVMEAVAPFADGDTAPPVPVRRGRVDLPPGARLRLRGEESEQAHLMLGVPGIDRHDDRRYALSVLNAALGGGMSSRLFQEVRESRGLAYSVYSSVGSYADTGSVAVYVGCRPERLGRTVAVVAEVLAGVAATGLTEAEIVRAKGQLRGGLVLGLEDAASRMTRIGKSELNYGHHLSVDQTLSRIAAVTVEEVAELARELLDQPVRAAVVGPYSAAEDLPDEVHEVIS